MNIEYIRRFRSRYRKSYRISQTSLAPFWAKLAIRMICDLCMSRMRRIGINVFSKMWTETEISPTWCRSRYNIRLYLDFGNMVSRDENRIMQIDKPNLSVIIHSMLDESSSSKLRSKLTKLVQTLKKPKTLFPISSQSQTGSRVYPAQKIQHYLNSTNFAIKNSQRSGRSQLTRRRPRFEK